MLLFEVFSGFLVVLYASARIRSPLSALSRKDCTHGGRDEKTGVEKRRRPVILLYYGPAGKYGRKQNTTWT
jgi:hypothetical protein